MPGIMGPSLMARDEQGQLRARIVTVFPRTATVVTLPGIHASQREAYIESVNRARLQQGKPPLSEEEQSAEVEQSVDVLVDEQGVLIRPDPGRMDLAFEADELLQELVAKRLIKYLFLSDRRVRGALKRRGECWRMYLPPTAPEEIRRSIAESRSAIGGRSIYYYSPITGTRLLTYDTFRKMAAMEDEELRRHLAEIATYGARRHRNGCCEVELFMTGGGCSCAAFPPPGDLPPDHEGLRRRFEGLCERFGAAVPAEFRVDDLDDPVWRSRMFARLFVHRDDVLVDEETMGLDAEFSMRVEWLPGGRIEEGELILDSAIEEPYGRQNERQMSPVVRGLILNLVQEYGDLEYINLGSVLPSPGRNPRRGGRRDVYVAQIKQRRSAAEILQIIRLQKWGVRERLEEGKSLEQAMMEAEEYTEYVFDRLLGCRQLGMYLPQRLTARKVGERYDGCNRRYAGYTIWSPYFQRDYIAGIATDRLPNRKLSDRAYAVSFARLLGQAAASNIIVGRAELTGEAVFDVGDEIVVEDAAGMPAEIVVADHVGTFVDWQRSLESRAAEYAAPIIRRLGAVPDRGEFVEAYLSGFAERFIRIQEEYARHRRAFDTLFKHRPWDPAGSLSCRWSWVLQRLQQAEGRKLAEAIRGAMKG